MTQEAPRPAGPSSLVLPIAVVVLAIIIFIVDTVTSADIAVAVLYVAVVLIASRFFQGRDVWLVGAGCICLTVLSYYITFDIGAIIDGFVNMVLCVGAIGLTAFLVTQEQSAEAALREQAKLLDLTHDGVFSRGLDGRITSWNRGAEELFGWKKAEALGKPSHQLLAKTFPAPHDEIEAELLRTGRWEGEIVCTTRHGTHIVVASRWALKRDRLGRPVAVLETNSDITERKQAEEALRQAQTSLERLNRVMLLGEMTASIAHEVSQPLAAVVTNAGACLRWLSAQPPNMEEADQALGRIVREGNRASEVIARIRALIRKRPPHRTRLNVNEAILEVIALTEGDLQSNRVTLQTRLSDTLPLVSADRVQLQQVLLNLIANAIEAMSELADGPRELTVTSGASNSHAVFVEVRDSGPGLDPAGLENLFDPFYTTKPDGTGMGLAICRSIVDAHGGRLSAMPNQPRGAIFRFTLPVQATTSNGQELARA